MELSATSGMDHGSIAEVVVNRAISMMFGRRLWKTMVFALFNSAGLRWVGGKSTWNLNIGMFGPIIVAHPSRHDMTERLMKKMQ